MKSRRKTLALIGGGTVLAAAGAAAVSFVTTRTPHTALAPWEKAGGYADLRKWALSYAILAPSAHNRQPWLIGLAGDDTVILWRDRSRDLPHTDPFHRQLVISLGCFLEQMKIAAAEKHIGVRFTLYPAGEDGPVAVAVFEQGPPRQTRCLLRYSTAGPVMSRSPINRWHQRRQRNCKIMPRLSLTLSGWLR